MVKKTNYWGNFIRITVIVVVILIQCILFKFWCNDIESPTDFPHFSDLEEGFEKEIQFVKQSVLLPYASKETFKSDVILPLPRGILFRGQGPVELIAHALANEGGYNILKLPESDLLYEMSYSKTKQTQMQLVFAKLKWSSWFSPSILFIPKFSKDRYKIIEKERGLIDLLEIMEDASGQVIVIGIVPEDDNLVSKYAAYFPYIFYFPEGIISPQKRKTMLKLATRSWKFSPSSEILKKVADCKKINSMEEIENLANSVYDHVIKQNFPVKANDTVSKEINPSLEDWLVVVENKFGDLY